MEENEFILSNDGMDTLMINLYNRIDSILAPLNAIKEKVYDLNNYFTGSVADDYQAKFAAYTQQITLIRDNLNTYIQDLMIVKEVFNEKDQKTAASLAKDAQAKETEARKLIDKVVVGDLTIEKQ